MLLCFVIVFGSVSKPVKAIAGLDDAVYFVLGSFCLSLAVDIAVDNPATGEELLRLWNALSDGSQRAVQAAANGIVWYGNTVYDWEVETWTSVANEIKSWFDDNHSSGTDFGEVVADNANGYIGFTPDTSFRCYFPLNVSTATFILPHSVLFGFSKVAISNTPFYGSYYCSSDSSSSYYVSPSSDVSGYMLKSSTGLSFVSWDNWYNSFGGSNRDLGGKYFYSYCSATTPPNPDYYSIRIDNMYTNPLYRSSSNKYFYYDDNTGYSYSLVSENGSYAFKNSSTGVYFQNLTFSSQLAALDWFLHSCGFVTYTYDYVDVDPYVEPVSSDGITYDSDATQNAIDNIGDHVIDDSLPMVIPGSDANLQDLADNPSAVWDIGATGVYSGDVDLPSVPGSVWSDKFPFCIPFDIVRLFTSFSEEAEAPHFHFCVIPENSFGLQNEAIYWDIDFADYDILVKILRVFIALAFTLWLIMITRKVIGA